MISISLWSLCSWLLVVTEAEQGWMKPASCLCKHGVVDPSAAAAFHGDAVPLQPPQSGSDSFGFLGEQRQGGCYLFSICAESLNARGKGSEAGRTAAVLPSTVTWSYQAPCSQETPRPTQRTACYGHSLPALLLWASHYRLTPADPPEAQSRSAGLGQVPR